MNDNLKPSDPLNEVPPADDEVRKVLRRARRTLAPFSEEPSPAKPCGTDEETAVQEAEETSAPPEVPCEENSECTPMADEIDESSLFVKNAPLSREVEACETEAEENEKAFSALFSDGKEPETEETVSLREEAQPKNSEITREDTEASLDQTNLYREPEAQEKTLSAAANVFDWIKSFLFSLTTVVFIFTLLFRGVTVNGGSMLPTLENNEYLIISNLFYTPETGDIVVVQSPHYKSGTEPLIKRIIATGGQTVKIDFTSWQVWVDGELLEEDYILRDGASTMNSEDMIPNEDGICEITVEENCIFVMGDHRNDSLDSRSESVGQIDERYIMGRVVLRITPLERFGKVD